MIEFPWTVLVGGAKREFRVENRVHGTGPGPKEQADSIDGSGKTRQSQVSPLADETGRRNAGWNRFALSEGVKS
ncbi:MAG: hypothetical protein CMJ65_05620 [Planctomycetaceae bacterium]|nr:hypothetical protein [Planctomycetaceae bacterium]